MKSGLYCLWNTKLGKIYASSSSNVVKRIKEHFSGHGQRKTASGYSLLQ